MLERYDIKQLPDYFADKGYLCLHCLSNEIQGNVYCTDDFCRCCLRWMRNLPSDYELEDVQLFGMIVPIANNFSINFGIDVLKNLIDKFKWEKVSLQENRAELIQIIEGSLTENFSNLDESDKVFFKHIYEECSKYDNILIIVMHYIDLYNNICNYEDENLKLIDMISVRKLFGYHSYDLIMSGKNLSVIIGTNGLGKTTIFRILKAILVEGKSLYESYKKLKYILSIPFDEIEIIFRDGTKIKLTQYINSENEKFLQFNLNNDIKHVFQEDKKLEMILENFKDVTSFVDFKGSLSQEDQGFAMVASVHMKSIYDAIRINFPKLKVLKERFLFIETKRIELDELCQNLKELEKSDVNNKKFAKLSDSFFKLYYAKDPSRKTLEFDENNNLVVRTSTDKQIRVNCLSSGEKGALQILYDVIYNSGKNAIILIDEPEISLHITWQLQIAEVIADIAEERDGSQIIIATHSPFIATASNDEDKGYIVEAELK